ncbi:MAG TPA: hypothetical protein VMY87_11170 [Armatimonadota bacterium]|nr:hypothetical protein [Armatimonadota bacterium]
MTESRLEWTTHLARRRPIQAAAAVAVIAAASLAAGFGFQSVLLGLLAAALLIASVSDYLFPLTFTLTNEAAEARGPLHRRRLVWSRVRRVARDDLGVKLSPLLQPSRLDAFRGIYLWFEDNADDVMAFIAHHVQAEAAGGDDFSSV